MITRQEKALLIALGILAVLLLGSFGASKAYEAYRAQQDRAEMASIDSTYPVGKTAHLSSDEDGRPLGTGTAYEAHFGWDGAMDVTVVGTKVFERAEDAESGIEAFDDACWLGDAPFNEDASRLVVVEVEITNKGAASEYTTRTGQRLFNISFLNIVPSGSLVYFDGAPEDANRDLGESTYFDMNEGETKRFQVGYSVSRDVPLDEVALYAGMAYLPEKYRFDLGLEDS